MDSACVPRYLGREWKDHICLTLLTCGCQSFLTQVYFRATKVTNCIEVEVLMGLNRPACSTYKGIGLHLMVSSGYFRCLLATVPL